MNFKMEQCCVVFTFIHCLDARFTLAYSDCVNFLFHVLKSRSCNYINFKSLVQDKLHSAMLTKGEVSIFRGEGWIGVGGGAVVPDQTFYINFQSE